MSALQRDREISFSLVSITDIVFLLMIFFIALSSFVVTGGIKIKLPSSSLRQLTKSPLAIEIDKNGHYFIENREVPPEKLEETILQNKKIMEHRGFIIRADRDCSVASLVFLLNIAYKNNLQTTLATVKESSR